MSFIRPSATSRGSSLLSFSTISSESMKFWDSLEFWELPLFKFHIHQNSQNLLSPQIMNHRSAGEGRAQEFLQNFHHLSVSPLLLLLTPVFFFWWSRFGSVPWISWVSSSLLLTTSSFFWCPRFKCRQWPFWKFWCFQKRLRSSNCTATCKYLIVS